MGKLYRFVSCALSLARALGATVFSMIHALIDHRLFSTLIISSKLYLPCKQAFREVGRVVPTAFLLQYLSDPEMRVQITSTTNTLEAYNGFTEWIVFGGEGVIGTQDPDEQEKRVKYTDLVANAVILQNTVDLTDALRELAGVGYEIKREDLELLSPYWTSHIKRLGDYVLDWEELPPPLVKAYPSCIARGQGVDTTGGSACPILRVSRSYAHEKSRATGVQENEGRSSPGGAWVSPETSYSQYLA